MSMKTKDRCGKSEGEAGMLQKTKGLLLYSGNVAENKGARPVCGMGYVVGATCSLVCGMAYGGMGNGVWGRSQVGKGLPPLTTYPIPHTVALRDAPTFDL